MFDWLSPREPVDFFLFFFSLILSQLGRPISDSIDFKNAKCGNRKIGPYLCTVFRIQQDK